ncbi:MAG: hypothetical protein IPF77_11790 [Gemmatimonadetes bacterium]|nr:hypothetical protein [Gemmatimonadota bacterium]
MGAEREGGGLEQPHRRGLVGDAVGPPVSAVEMGRTVSRVAVLAVVPGRGSPRSSGRA